MKKIKIPFDSRKLFLGYKIVTRGDVPVRVICSDFKDKDFSIIALMDKGDEEMLIYTNKDGIFNVDTYKEHIYDLFFTYIEFEPGDKVKIKPDPILIHYYQREFDLDNIYTVKQYTEELTRIELNEVKHYTFPVYILEIVE